MCDHLTSGQSRLVQDKLVMVLVCDMCGVTTQNVSNMVYTCSPKLEALLQPKK